MKITRSQLKQIIKEELTKALREAKRPWFPIPEKDKPKRKRPHLRRPPPRPRPVPPEIEDDPSPRGSTNIDYSMEEAEQLELPMTHEPYGGRTKQFGDHTVTYVESRKEWSPRWRMGIRAFKINGEDFFVHGDYSRLPDYHEVQDLIWARLKYEDERNSDVETWEPSLRGGDAADLGMWAEGLFGREQ